ncbi:MAG: aminotransferase class I/II-fold pyridoxal phosphate-dependent enzyme [Clostridia bacterium]|nr:aminotransferase class I/II-fold pyridoxal phosphate-dependent enzyme [Clostridia bacterium]
MLYFVNDYSEGAQPRILEALSRTNFEQLSGYGTDRYTQSAKEKIRRACDCEQADVWFLAGGTQTNQLVIAAMLDTTEGVIAAQTGHVASHEAGAIEHSGHKVLTLPAHDGKLDAAEVRAYLRHFYDDENHNHMVFPGMVYISHPTEFGTLYTKAELEALRAVCDEYRLPLFMDGARLGYALACEQSDVTLPDVAALCDVFYIGGTKVGALCGEAVVFTKQNTPKRFMTVIKQHGALLAKGRLLGVQFDALFTDDLYLEGARHALRAAKRIRAALLEKGYTLYVDSPTNQLFPVLGDAALARLQEQVAYSFWERLEDGRTVIRLATSWATTDEDVDKLINAL